ncbi:hypothetical protein [Clostridium tunisiense]|uniref:hypothetical protein n=1 Tax=Clostridium tunisiense TaxID=219748 RepID=UPI0003070D0D|nr:hypothetical protein [Clostridium tunisiense]
MDVNQIRERLLEVISEYSKQGPGYFQQSNVLRETAKSLDIKGDLELEQILLTEWNELFRIGYLAWGYDIANPEPPFCHLTLKAKENLKKFSRDPANQGGYLNYLTSNSGLNSIAISYITEALETYNNNCIKATAVMVGCASESVILELRDVLVGKMNSLGKTVPSKLNDWRIKTVIDSLTDELDKCKPLFGQKLKEQYSAYWMSLSCQIRITRNDAGHPTSITPVATDNVYASLLIFPELCKLVYDLTQWIKSTYK